VGYGAAFQVGKVSNVAGFCKRIGGPASGGLLLPMGGPRWGRSALASGVTLFYPGGDLCPDPYNSSNFIPRSVSFDFMCSDANGFTPRYDTILEDVRCSYHAIIKSRVGCPLECARGGPTNRVCAANGICGYDMTNGYAKCFCNAGFSGPDCTAVGDKGLPPPPDYSPNVAGGFFGGLFGGIAAAVIAFAVRSKMAGGGLFDGFSLGGFGGRSGGGGAGAAAGRYAPALSAAGSAWAGEAINAGAPAAGGTGYVAPDALAGGPGAAGAGGAGGFGDVYGQLGGGDGPLLG
jgi:hypothetical protein